MNLINPEKESDTEKQKSTEIQYFTKQLMNYK
jgi:hypothetical protein